MATSTKEKPSISTTQVMYEILVKAGKPLTTKEIVEKTLADKRAHWKGDTPQITLSAVLYKVAGQGRLFKRVGKGTFAAIVDKPAKTAAPKAAATAAKPAAKKAQAKPDPKVKRAQPKKAKQRRRSSPRSAVKA